MTAKFLQISATSIAAILALSAQSSAASAGTDNASSNAYLPTDGNGGNDGDPTNNTNGWVSGDDGFVLGSAALAPWALSTSGTAGFFIGDSRNLSGGSGADLNSVGNNSFGMYGTSGSFSNAERAFDSALGLGHSFSIDLGVNFRNGQKGIDLRNSSNVVLFNFNVGNLGAGDDYTVQFAATGNGSIGNGYSSNTKFSLTFTQTTIGGGTWQIIRSGGVSDSDSGTYTGVAANFKLYVSNTSGGSESDLYANNISVVPEPASSVLLVGALTGLGLMRRRRA